MHTRTYTCWRPKYPYSHTHTEFCAVILKAATHVRANEFQLKVLAISVPTFRRLPLCLSMTLCGHICVLVRHCVWLRCPDSGAKTCVIHIERPHLFHGCDISRWPWMAGSKWPSVWTWIYHPCLHFLSQTASCPLVLSLSSLPESCIKWVGTKGRDTVLEGTSSSWRLPWLSSG